MLAVPRPNSTCYRAPPLMVPAQRRRRLPALVPLPAELLAAARLLVTRAADVAATGMVATSELVWLSQCPHPIHPACA